MRLYLHETGHSQILAYSVPSVALRYHKAFQFGLLNHQNVTETHLTPVPRSIRYKPIGDLYALVCI